MQGGAQIVCQFEIKLTHDQNAPAERTGCMDGFYVASARSDRTVDSSARSYGGLRAETVTRKPIGADEVERAQKDIGTKRWFRATGTTSLCKVADLKECRSITSGTAVVEAVEARDIGASPTRFVEPVYLVVLEDGSRGYLGASDFTRMNDEAVHRRELAEKAECDRRGGIAVGMPSKQVEASCWGKPTRINRTDTASGSHEQWVYPGYNYVHLNNGVVSSISTSR
jgi:hypothetical protein